ncbi:MAG: DPP IV N-terminal domain-containing protein [Phycisphaerae bacterium]|nr:DPP IV N-terminal domain-containing protein [Phycisphaerae bacterium]
MTRAARIPSRRPVVLFLALAFVQVLNTSQAFAQGGFRPARPVQGLYKDRITPHWLAGNTRFWYRNDLAGKTKEFILVDAERGTRQPVFDHAKLAAALSETMKAQYKADQLPFDTIAFADGGEVLNFTVDQTTWACRLATYTCSPTALGPVPSSDSQGDATSASWRRSRGPGRERGPSADSPDGKWTAFVKDGNVFVRDRGGDREVQLSTDGAEENAYGVLSWAPDSKTLVAWRIEPGDGKEVYLIESSPKGGGRAKFSKRPYALPGDKFKTYELNLFDIEAKKQIKPDVDKLELDWEVPRLHWNVAGPPWRGRPALGKQGQDGLETQGQDALATRGCYFAYEKADRGHQRFRVIEVDSHTGQVRNLIDEKTDTFIWTAHTENLDLRLVNWLDKSDEILYVSERDGWRHLYLIDAAKGEVRNQITKGEWVVCGIDLIDEDARQVWFHACGKNANEDPYFIHYYRVNFDGSGLVALTEGNGTHSIQYSPDRRYLIDTYSRVDMAPVHDLRRVSDGKLVCPLEKADISELIASGWAAPEVFVAKGRDGKTDIWGILCRPKDLDPSKKYPVIEQIYAGPQGSYVPKRFSPYRQFASLADLGFIVV